VGKPHKYGAVATEVDGIRFASKAEARRYGQLKLLEKAGRISDLKLQPRFPLTVEGVKVGTYVGDFQYTEIGSDGAAKARVTEDVKGVKTPLYVLKRKLVKAIYGIDILEIG
jgi:hypothetical protein